MIVPILVMRAHAAVLKGGGSTRAIVAGTRAESLQTCQ
jgi:hypothetical protein